MMSTEKRLIKNLHKEPFVKEISFDMKALLAYRVSQITRKAFHSRNKSNSNSCGKSCSLPLLNRKNQPVELQRCVFVRKDLQSLSFLAREIQTPSKMRRDPTKERKKPEYFWRDLTRNKVKIKSAWDEGKTLNRNKWLIKKNIPIKYNDDKLITRYMNLIKEKTEEEKEESDSLRKRIKRALRRLERDINNQKEFSNYY